MSEQRTTTIGTLVEEGVLEFGDGYRTKRSELGTPGLPILRVAEVLDGRISPAFTDHVHNSYIKKMGSKVSRPRDIVLTTKGTVGRVAIMPDSSPEFIYSPQVCYFRINETAFMDRGFLYNWLKSNEFWQQASSLMSQTDMAAYLNMADIRSLRITIPELWTQRSIAVALGALDDKIAVNERIITTYEEILQTRFDHLITTEHQGHTPETLATKFVEFNPKTAKITEEEAVYVDMAALPTDRAPISTWTHRKPKSGSRFVNGDTLLARITPCLENGKTGYVDFMGDGQIGTGSTEFIVMRSRPGIPQEFSYFLARNKHFRSHAIQKMAGTSGRQRVSASDASNFFIRQLTYEELRTFGAESSKAFVHMKSLTAESRTLAELRDTLLPQLMSGKLRVKDAEKIVEDNV